MRGTTAAVQADVDFIGISTHVPHAGHDPSARYPLLSCADFNSRAPCGARPCCGTTAFPRHLFQLTCPMRGTTAGRRLRRNYLQISTHVPHAGHDRPKPVTIVVRIEISTHVPHAGHDSGCPPLHSCISHFNSRAPCGARLNITIIILRGTNFNSRAPCGARLQHADHVHDYVFISTHVPHAGHDRLTGGPT